MQNQARKPDKRSEEPRPERRNWHTQGILQDPDAFDSQAAERDRALRRIALFLHSSVKNVQNNLANSLLTVLCRIPENTPLRRSQDKTIVRDVALLFEDIEPDDLRRPRLKFLLEAIQWRARLG